MDKYQGLFIGLTTIDIQYFVEKFPEPNVKVKTLPPDILVGGPATNAAVAFSALNGGNAFLSTAVGLNSFTQFIQNDFDFTNVKHFDVALNKAFNPVLATVVTSSKNGDRNIFTHNPEDFQTEINVKQLFAEITPKIVMLDGFYPEFAFKCARIAKQNNIPVVLDCGSWKPQYQHLFKYTDVVICSNDFYPPGCSNSNDVFHFLKTNGIDKIAISKGNKNIEFSDNENRGEVEINTVEVVDTLGAGDFLHGAFCFYYLQTGNFITALKKASETATFSCKFKGTRDWLNFTK